MSEKVYIISVGMTKFGKFLEKSIKKSSAVDVTGGMKTKVDEMLQLIIKLNNVEIIIFSARKEESLFKALTGDINGTIISAE